MRLKKITLENFRRFDRLDVELHPRLTVLVGDNGAGKTSVLDGIATALSPVLAGMSTASQRLSGRGIKDADFLLEPSPVKGGRTRWLTADYARVSAETTQGLVWDYWRSSGSGGEPQEKIGTTGLRQYLQPILESYKSEAQLLTPVFAYYGARRGYIEVPERLRAARENYDNPASALLGALDSLSDFREMLAWFDREESNELRANKGASDEDYDPSAALEAVRATVVSLLNGAYGAPRFNKDHKFVLDRLEDGAQLLVSQLSQGYQSMLALAMDYSRRLAIANGHVVYGNPDGADLVFEEIDSLRALDPGFLESTDSPYQEALVMSTPGIMLIDEIDLHLHPSWQQRILGDLLRTFPLTQFIVTTHSPQVLSTVNRDNIRVLKNSDTGNAAEKPAFSPLAHEAGDALAKIMGVNREPELPLQESIRAYEQLVRSGGEQSPSAQELRGRLDQHGYQIHASDLATWRFLAGRKVGNSKA